MDLTIKDIEHPELEKAKPMITVEIIEYVENAVVLKTILKKSSGNISVMSVDTGEGLTERTSPFDTFAQVIEKNRGQFHYINLKHCRPSSYFKSAPGHFLPRWFMR